MKLLIKQSRSEKDGESLDPLSGSQTSLEIPNITITWLTILFLVIQTIGTLVGNAINIRPQRESNKEMFEIKKQNFQIQLLQRVLELDSIQDRKMSLSLLVKCGLLGQENNVNLIRYIDSSKYAPKWSKRPLDSLSSYLCLCVNDTAASTARATSSVVNRPKPSEGGAGNTSTTVQSVSPNR